MAILSEGFTSTNRQLFGITSEALVSNSFLLLLVRHLLLLVRHLLLLAWHLFPSQGLNIESQWVSPPERAEAVRDLKEASLKRRGKAIPRSRRSFELMLIELKEIWT